jgi:hypothetical protein
MSWLWSNRKNVFGTGLFVQNGAKRMQNPGFSETQQSEYLYA